MRKKGGKKEEERQEERKKRNCLITVWILLFVESLQHLHSLCCPVTWNALNPHTNTHTVIYTARYKSMRTHKQCIHMGQLSTRTYMDKETPGANPDLERGPGLR